MHPDVCAFISEVFYDGRVRSKPACRTCASTLPTAGWDGPALRSRRAPGQPQRVCRRGPTVSGWSSSSPVVDVDGQQGQHPATRAKDVLVVAPYNAHVALLRQRLPRGVAVGTVDKFQGQEAPIVIYSMATSTPEDAPRGMEFLYSGNRLNVALSRAQALVILVNSPELLYARCRTPAELAQANALCRFVELATPC